MNQDSRAEADAVIAERDKRRFERATGVDGAWDDNNSPVAVMDERKKATKKVDHGKPNLSIILDAKRTMSDFAVIIEEGGKKDGRTLTSWKDYDDARGLESALMRHLLAWHNGEKKDPESGLSHLSHVVANAIMLRETEK